MHASDRTLIARLGFADPDKRDQLHDLACQYVVQPAAVEAMGLAVVASDKSTTPLRLDPSSRAQFECPISKGEGQYKTTIGFVDVVLPMGYDYLTKWHPVPVFVEVKIAPVGLGEVLRQIRLYEEYVGGQLWVLVAAFELSESLVRGLRDEHVKPVQLGPNFRAWAAEQKSAPRAADVVTI